MRLFLTAFFLTTAIAASGTPVAAAGPLCKPKLSVKDIRFSDVQRETQ